MTPKQREAMQMALDWFDWFHNSKVRPAELSTTVEEAIREALAEPDVPEGCRLVPIEPTTYMRTRFKTAHDELVKMHLLSGSYPAEWQPFEAGYKAMLAAAPTTET